VETVGDAYMVSSGIPIRNPGHASELADMALTLCHGVTKFKVMSKFQQMTGRVVNVNDDCFNLTTACKEAI